MSMAGAETQHATLVSNVGAGVLLRGPSGSGKSDLALRLLNLGPDWRLVSDDQVALSRNGSVIMGRAPAAISGKLEVRGIGIVDVAVAPETEIRLIVDLVERADVPRMAELDQTSNLLGAAIPSARLHAFDASAPLKVVMLLRLAEVRAALRKN